MSISERHFTVENDYGRTPKESIILYFKDFLVKKKKKTIRDVDVNNSLNSLNFLNYISQCFLVTRKYELVSQIKKKMNL